MSSVFDSIDNLSSACGATTIFVTDADSRELLEYDGSTGVTLRWYASGLGPNAALGQINVAAGTRTIPIPDLQGSIVGSVDASTGRDQRRG